MSEAGAGQPVLACRGLEKTYSDARVPVRVLNFLWHRLEWPPVEMLAGPVDVVHREIEEAKIDTFTRRFQFHGIPAWSATTH